ncbi:uncharacterized protein [Miscanthus floridulus]|uniref:uncharacterized protein isoform X1 n=1 Tax=Miscanthus floridulus TaxID=154761 RepID=UPI0034592316
MRLHFLNKFILPWKKTVLPIEKRIEAYDGENEELDNLEALLSVREEPPSLQEFLGAGPIAAADEVQVEQGGNQMTYKPAFAKGNGTVRSTY